MTYNVKNVEYKHVRWVLYGFKIQVPCFQIKIDIIVYSNIKFNEHQVSGVDMIIIKMSLFWRAVTAH